MGSSHTLDRLDICFDDTHAVANAGLLLPATLAERLGIEQTRRCADRPGRAGWRRHQIHYSITVRQTKPIRQAIQAIDEAAWTDIVYPDGGLAQVAETRYQGDR